MACGSLWRRLHGSAQRCKLGVAASGCLACAGNRCGATRGATKRVISVLCIDLVALVSYMPLANYGCGHHGSICRVTRRPRRSPTCFFSTPNVLSTACGKGFPDPAVHSSADLTRPRSSTLHAVAATQQQKMAAHVDAAAQSSPTTQSQVNTTRRLSRRRHEAKPRKYDGNDIATRDAERLRGV